MACVSIPFCYPAGTINSDFHRGRTLLRKPPYSSLSSIVSTRRQFKEIPILMVRVLDTEITGAMAQTIPTGRQGTIRLGFGTLAVVVCLLSNGALAAQEDSITALIRQQTDISSAAGQRGDQATVEKYLDDAVLFSAGDGTVQRDTKLDQNDAVSMLLKQQTQAFCEASQRGDLAKMRSYLDDQVLFINEEGVAFNRKDFAGGAPATAPKGTHSTVAITDWVLHSSDNVAVSSFV